MTEAFNINETLHRHKHEWSIHSVFPCRNEWIEESLVDRHHGTKMPCEYGCCILISSIRILCFGWRIWMVYLDGVLSLSEWQLLDWPWSLWHPPPCPACWPSDHSLTCFLISQMNDQQRDVCYKKTVKWGNFLKSGTPNEFSPEAFLFSSIFFYFLLFLLFSPLKTFKV